MPPFNNISVLSWWSVLFVEESGEDHKPVASHWQTLSHNVVSYVIGICYSSANHSEQRLVGLDSG
jgi:hypothetical protein